MTTIISLSLILHTPTTSIHSSSFTITPTQQASSPFSDNHSLYVLPFIPKILAPCPLHLISCKQHTIILFLSSLQTSPPFPTQTTHIPHPNPQPKAPIRPPIILQAILALPRMRCITFLSMVGRYRPTQHLD